MWVNGEYIRRDDPRHVPGRYASWADVPQDGNAPDAVEPSTPPVTIINRGPATITAVHRDPVAQRQFKKYITLRDGHCVLTGLPGELCHAAHIKPVSECEPNETFDLDNGFLLAPTQHAMFDAGWFTFTDEGEVLTRGTQARWCPPGRITLCMGQQEYMRWHRQHHGFIDPRVDD